MKRAKYHCLIFFSFFGINSIYSQQTRYLEFLVDSLPKETPVLLNMDVDGRYMAVERVAISNNGKELYYGVRNGYDSNSKAKILKIIYNKKKWGKPLVVHADSCGAPALSDDGKTMFFQFDHPISPKGLYSMKTKNGWSKPIQFIDTLKMSHYLQEPSNNKYYYSALINGKTDKRDIFKVEVSRSDTVIKSLGFNLKGNKCCTDIFVADDESYIILTLFKAENEKEYNFYGELDLFITFKESNNKWSKPLNLGEKINGLSDWTWGPYVTNDEKYLLFSSWAETVGVYMIGFDKIYDKLKVDTN